MTRCSSSYTFFFLGKDRYGNVINVQKQPLVTVRCRHRTAAGTRCRRQTSIGAGHCYQHMRRDLRLVVRPCEYGKGVFAFGKGVVHRDEAIVAGYESRYVNMSQIDKEYGNFVAPYAVAFYPGDVGQDGATLRGIGSMINHSDFPNCRLSVDETVTPPVCNVVATCDIEGGSELTIHYNAGETWEDCERLYTLDTVMPNGNEYCHATCRTKPVFWTEEVEKKWKQT